MSRGEKSHDIRRKDSLFLTFPIQFNVEFLLLIPFIESPCSHYLICNQTNVVVPVKFGQKLELNIKMNSEILQEVKVNVQIKLSALWATLTFAYAYADVLGFYSPGNLAEILAGEIGGIPLTQEMLLAMAILMAIPIVMVFLPLILPAKVNRIFNIIIGIVYIVVLVAASLVAPTAYYLVFAGIEVMCLLLIVWFAYKWPKETE